MKTILTVLREQDKTGDTIGKALGGGTIAEALEASADSDSDTNESDDSGSDANGSNTNESDAGGSNAESGGES